MTFTNPNIQIQSSQLVPDMDLENELQYLLGNDSNDRAGDNRSRGIGQLFITGFWVGILTVSAIMIAVLTYTYAIGVPFIQS